MKKVFINMLEILQPIIIIFGCMASYFGLLFWGLANPNSWFISNFTIQFGLIVFLAVPLSWYMIGKFLGEFIRKKKLISDTAQKQESCFHCYGECTSCQRGKTALGVGED